MNPPTRTYRCTNGCCPQIGIEHTVQADPVGPFWSFSDLVCGCGYIPMLVGDSVRPHLFAELNRPISS